LFAPCDFILDQQREELGVGDLAVEGLAIAGFGRIEDAGQTQLLEIGYRRQCRRHQHARGVAAR
jgi:hypothetical protein